SRANTFRWSNRCGEFQQQLWISVDSGSQFDSKLTEMKYPHAELAKMIDHSLLHPTMTDQELEDGCKLAAKYGVASVCIKPYAVKRAAELLKDSGVFVGAVIGFPHGNSTTESKRYETELACKDGAV